MSGLDSGQTSRGGLGNASMPPTRQPTEAESASPKRTGSKYNSGLHLLLARHIYAALTSLGRMTRAPVATLMTVCVIGLSLALPMGLYLILDTAKTLGTQWEQGTHISLFMKMDVPEAQTKAVMKRLQMNPDIAEVKYISPKAGLADFQRYSGFGDLLNSLPSNPLPGVIEVKPTVLTQSAVVVEHLLQQLQGISEVDVAKLDMQWIKRLYAIIDVASRAIWAVGLLLGIGVMLVVGNTIRLAVEKYREELEVISLVGGTNAFVRRPYLYLGAFYGAFGGVIAWLCVDLTLLWVQGPVDTLANLYETHFQFQELGFSAIASLVCFGGLLGLMGAFIAVERYLRQLSAESLRL